jgi:hypothetical protein
LLSKEGLSFFAVSLFDPVLDSIVTDSVFDSIVKASGGLRPSPVCSSLLFPSSLCKMVKFAAAARLFSDGHVGNSLVSELLLPPGTFQEESTWNQLQSTPP